MLGPCALPAPLPRAVQLPLLGLLMACGGQGHAVAPPPRSLVSLTVTGSGAQRLAELHPAPGVRINARVRPTLELQDGSLIHFTGEERLSDSGYFSGIPAAAIGTTLERTALLRASVCPVAERICVSVVTDVDLPR
jgi:hypothetical protein